MFAKHLPVIEALASGCVRDRHWVKVSVIVGITVSLEHPGTVAAAAGPGGAEQRRKSRPACGNWAGT